MTDISLSTSPTTVTDISSLFHSLTIGKDDSGDESSVITSFSGLLEELPRALSDRKTKDIEPGASNDPVSLLLRQIAFERCEWEPYAFFDSSKPYTRNLIATDNETYTLLLLCWNPNEESPIHDHPCDGCWLKVLQGNVRECRYDENLCCTADDIFQQGELTYITDSLGYHKVGNPTRTPSVSLHLYSPPFSRCRVWRDASKRMASSVDFCNYSEYGHLVTKE